MSYPPPLPPKTNPSPQRRPTYGTYPGDHDAPPPPAEYPRRRPVGLPPRPNPLDNHGSRGTRRQDSYGAPPVNGSGRPFSYDWPTAAQSTASGYDEPKSTLVYPEEALFDPPPPTPTPPPPPPPPRQQGHSRGGNGYASPTEDIFREYTSARPGVND